MGFFLADRCGHSRGTRTRHLYQHLTPERLRPPAGLASPRRPCPVGTAASHPRPRRPGPGEQNPGPGAGPSAGPGEGVGAAGPEHGAGHGTRLSSRPCRLALRSTLHHQPGAPPRRLTWPCQRPTPQPSHRRLPASCLAATPPTLPCPCSPCALPMLPCLPALLPMALACDSFNFYTKYLMDKILSIIII